MWMNQVFRTIGPGPHEAVCRAYCVVKIHFPKFRHQIKRQCKHMLMQSKVFFYSMFMFNAQIRFRICHEYFSRCWREVVYVYHQLELLDLAWMRSCEVGEIEMLSIQRQRRELLICLFNECHSLFCYPSNECLAI